MDDGQRQIQSFIFSSLPGTTGDTFQGSINGGQQYSHEILIEGIPVGRADLSGGNNNEFSPSAEAIGEFKLQTGAIGASTTAARPRLRISRSSRARTICMGRRFTTSETKR